MGNFQPELAPPAARSWEPRAGREAVHVRKISAFFPAVVEWKFASLASLASLY